jgi:hypothetical protein
VTPDTLSQGLIEYHYEGNLMDFIERLFGISPDGGSGLFEVLLFVIPIAGILAVREWRKRSARK